MELEEPVPTGPRNFCAIAPVTFSVPRGVPLLQFCTTKLCRRDNTAACTSFTTGAPERLAPVDLTGWYTQTQLPATRPRTSVPVVPVARVRSSVTTTSSRAAMVTCPAALPCTYAEPRLQS